MRLSIPCPAPPRPAPHMQNRQRYLPNAEIIPLDIFLNCCARYQMNSSKNGAVYQKGIFIRSWATSWYLTPPLPSPSAGTPKSCSGSQFVFTFSSMTIGPVHLRICTHILNIQTCFLVLRTFLQTFDLFI